MRCTAVVLCLLSVLLLPSSSHAFQSSPSSNWTAAAPLLTARAGATATLLADKRILFVGGYDLSGTALSCVEAYNHDGSVTPLASMLVPRARHGAIALPNGRVLVTGGLNRDADNSGEIYDPKNSQKRTFSSICDDQHSIS